jgi:hypothetical protein
MHMRRRTGRPQRLSTTRIIAMGGVLLTVNLGALAVGRLPVAPRSPPAHRWCDPRRVIDGLDSRLSRRVWGRVPLLRIILAWGIWLVRYRLHLG